MLLLSSCTLGVSESPNVSDNIIESQKTNVFKCEYIAIQTPDSLFSIKEIWIEQGWRNIYQNPFFYKRILGDYCSLAISIYETPQSKYNSTNYGSWFLSDVQTAEINSIVNRQFVFDISNCELRDTIRLVLIKQDAAKNKNIVGNIRLIRKK